MKRLSFLFLAVVIGISCTTQSASSSIEKVNGVQFVDLYKTNKDNAILLDVRTPGEFQNGAILDAKNLNYYADNFKDEISKLDTTKIIFVYCKAGGRSASAAKKIADQGFKKIYDLKGGYSNFSQK